MLADRGTLRRSVRPGLLVAGLIASFLASGCASLTVPGADGVPVRLAPPELVAPVHAPEVPIPLTALRQPRPDVYRLAPGDVLGVYVEGFLGDRTQPLPVYVGDRVERPNERQAVPAAGYPVPVHENGTIQLPGVPPLPVTGRSIPETQQAIRDLYVKEKLINEKVDRVFVSLLQPRKYKVLVFRQETPVANQSQLGLDLNKRGSAFLIELPAYENDVLNALARTGGLPGADAENEVIVFRGSFRPDGEGDLLCQQLNRSPQQWLQSNLVENSTVTKIPLFVQPGCVPPITPPDIMLGNGDVVFLRGRNEQVFFTGGLLPPGAYYLPRDVPLDVLTAVSYVRGPLFNGAFGGSNLSGALIQPGLGNPSPRLLVVLRKTPNGGQIPLVVDLRRAMTDPQERIAVRANDMLILQEMPEDAVLRYAYQTFFNFNLLWTPINTNNVTGVVDVSAPDRLPGRLGQVNLFP